MKKRITGITIDGEEGTELNIKSYLDVISFDIVEGDFVFNPADKQVLIDAIEQLERDFDSYDNPNNL